MALCDLRQLCAAVFEHSVYLRGYINSVFYAAIATSLPADRLSDGARHRAREAPWRNILLLLVILPFWTSFLLRVYAWIGLIGNNSWFNKGLTWSINARSPAGAGSQHPSR